MSDLSAKGKKSVFWGVVEALTDTTAFRARMVVGGKLKRELMIMKYGAELVMELNRSQRLRTVDDASVDAEEAEMSLVCESDDPHVIALARLGRVKLLCTHDRLLMKDFKNRDLIKGGKIYTQEDHMALIKECCQHLAKDKSK